MPRARRLQAKDLVRKMLTRDPKKRLTAEQVLSNQAH
jgi:serine/threonine protein kinase